MPLRGNGHSDRACDDAPYFQTLAELDQWVNGPSSKLDGVLRYIRRSSDGDGQSPQNRGKLLVCHDYKGGYSEKPSGLSYTFNFWSQCDTFIYFSHHRVTVPPSGWINAAHRQGVKMLGTLIFEHDSGQGDCLRLLVGRLPQSKTGSAAPSPDTDLPLSPHYALLLADLAYQRGFDGYLLNVEVPLIGKVEQTRALAAWIAILRSELKRRVGPHAQTIWYDSVVVTGDLRWQNRLNNLNLPFFLPSTGFFTNYTWHSDFPSLTAQYFFSLDRALMMPPKSLQDIFIGVDVWGRGQHGGGRFGSYRSLAHIDPEFLGLSVALFGPAWTWESEQDKPGFSWETWWAYERKLWLGPPTEGEVVEVPPFVPRAGEPECEHGAFEPIATFFSRQAPPNPSKLPFLTYFSPGVGHAWFVQGAKLYESEGGWTDLDKNTSLGDMTWPRPLPQWVDGIQTSASPVATTSLCMTDAWLGGSSLQIKLSLPASGAEAETRRCLSLPVQTLMLTPRVSYTATFVYKTAASEPVEVDIRPSANAFSDPVSHTFEVTQKTPRSSCLPRGWMAISADVMLASDHTTDVPSIICLEVSFKAIATSYELDIFLGLLSTHPTSPPPGVLVHRPKILWADHSRSPAPSPPFSGTLTWEVAASFGPVTNSILPLDREDANPLWRLEAMFPSFAFFNIYVQVHPTRGSIAGPEAATWIGSTGLSGTRNAFYVDPACLPASLQEAKLARFYVQGVTDRGVVLGWENCVFVDARIATA